MTDENMQTEVQIDGHFHLFYRVIIRKVMT